MNTSLSDDSLETLSDTGDNVDSLDNLSESDVEDATVEIARKTLK